MNLVRYEADEWEKYAEACHGLVFNEHRPASMDRISYALIAGDDRSPVGYVTCRELDSESVYWQYGGVVEDRRGVAGYKSINLIHDYAKELYKRVTTYVENDNIGYLHILMKLGFRVIGIRTFKCKIYLELYKEF